MTQRNILAGIVTLSLVAVVAYSLYIWFFLGPAFSRLVVGHAQKDSEQLAAHLSSRFFRGAGLIPAGEITPSFRDEVAVQLGNFELEKVRAFAADGTVVFSSDPAEEGTRNTNPYFHEIVAGGRTHTALVPRDGKTLEGRTVQAAVVEIYVPVMREGRFAGAFEVYRDATGWNREIRHLLVRSTLVVLLLTCGLLATVAVASRRTVQALRDRDRAALVLQQERNSHDDLERLIAERSTALKGANRRLQDLSGHLQNVREEERTRIAREIHDELGQSLTAMRMELSLLRRGLPADQRQSIERAGALTSLVDSTAQAVKRISQDLRPGILDHLGLSAAVEWQAEEFERRTGIPCDVTLEPGEITLDEERSTAVFRIFQEALTNVARHAQATDVSVLLRSDNAGLVLQVRDNGQGMEERRAPGRRFGIIGIQERVRAWNGSFDIASVKGEGTTVTVRLPPQLERVS